MLLRPLVSTANRAAGRKRLMMVMAPCSSSIISTTVVVQPGRPACRRWLSGAAEDAPPSAGAAAAATAATTAAAAATDTNAGGAAGDSKDDGRTWTWSTPSPNRPGRGGAEISIIPRYTRRSSSTSYHTKGSHEKRKAQGPHTDETRAGFVLLLCIGCRLS